MKKILALVVAFALCFTAVAGCFTATAEDAVPTITIKDATAADGAIVIPVEGTNLQSVDSYLITVVLPADYTDIAVDGMTKLGDNGGDYVVNGTTVKMLNEIEKIDTDNDGAIAFNVTAKVPAVEADRVDDVTATVDAGNADAQPVTVTVVAGKATIKAPAPEHTCTWENGVVTKRPTTTETGVRTFTCECGKTKDVEIPVAVVKNSTVDGDTYKIGKNLDLQSSIRIGFLVRTAFLDEAVDCYAIFTKDFYNTDGSVNETVSVVAEKDTFEPYSTNGTSNNRYRTLYSGLLAKEMGTVVRAELYRELADGTFECVQETYSIAQYASVVLPASSGYSDNLRKAVVDILNYGAAAQVYGNYNTDNLVNADFEEYQEQYATREVPSYTSCSARNDNPSKVIRLGRSLNLGSAVAIVADLKTPEGAVYSDVEGLKAKCVVEGKSEPIWIDSADFTVAASGDPFYQVNYDGFLAKEMGNSISISIYDGDTQISDEIVYSVESYADFVFKNYQETDSLYIMMQEMLKYGASAKLSF